MYSHITGFFIIWRITQRKSSDYSYISKKFEFPGGKIELGESKEDAEKKLQESLEEYVKNSEDLMNKFIAKSIQGTAYLEGEKDNEKQDENDKKEE